MSTDIGVVELPELARLARADLQRAVSMMTMESTRRLVDMYYQIQEFRKAADNHGRDEPGSVSQWVYDEMRRTEATIVRMLDAHSDRFPAGRWAKSQYGIGPVLAAGLLAYLDVRRSRTAGGFWRFAGQDPSVEWLGVDKAAALIASYRGGATGGKPTAADIAALAALSNRRIPLDRDDPWTWLTLRKHLARPPYNAKLKVLVWKIGQSFVKFSGHPECVYGHLYAERKAYEEIRNERGDYADQAAAALTSKRWGENETKACYEAGRLPPGRIVLRAQRYAAKLFLAHLHHVMFEVEYGKPPPRPYILEQEGHTHYLAPPGWPMAD